MGCPPDPVDVSIWRSGERIAALEERYHRLTGEYADAARLASEVGLDFVDLRGGLDREHFSQRTDVRPDEQNPYADEHAQYQLEAGYKAKVKNLEIAACELRTAILQAGQVSPNMATHRLFGKVREDHLRHREEDRAQAIGWLERQCEVLGYYTNAKNARKEGIDPHECARRIERARREITRLAALTPHELLHSRSPTELQVEKFEIPPRSS